jgi:hypothetical protein
LTHERAKNDIISTPYGGAIVAKREATASLSAQLAFALAKRL